MAARRPTTRGEKTKEPKNIGNFKIGQGAVVCTEAQLTGDITIGSNTVIHPTAVISAEGGPVVIGENNHIMEKVVIVNRKVPGKETQPLIIGNNNLFEFHSRCESLSVGSENIFEPKCVVGPNIVVSDYCVIGAECSVLSNERLPPGTVISGKDCRRWNKQVNIKSENHQQLEYLIKLLPNFHRTVKST